MDEATSLHERVLWPGGHKNATSARVIRHGRYVWEVRMSNRFLYSASVTAPRLASAWRRCLAAVNTNGL